jgi:release factor glutamine methyltransferase
VTTNDHRPAESVETLDHLVSQTAERVGSVPEARWIVAHVTAVPAAQLMSAHGGSVNDADVLTVRLLADRRAAGEPLQYVLGGWAFRGLEVKVDRRALVPRPETEQVVEVALAELRRRVLSPLSRAHPPAVVDLGTGSGVIALSLALEGWPAADDGDVEVWATDAAPEALALARENVVHLATSDSVAASRLRLAQGSWFDALPRRLRGRLDLVVSNPPYVSAPEWSALDPEVRHHEPRSALVAGPSGLEALTLLVEQSRHWLLPGGSLVLELAPHQAEEVTSTARRAGYVDLRVEPDLAGRPRVLVARRAGAPGAGEPTASDD